MNLPLSVIFELVCFFSSLSLFFQRGTPSHLKLFPFFLLVTILIEIMGMIFSRQGKSNIILYNLFAVFAVVFYLFSLMNFIHNLRVKKTILITIIIYPIFAIVNSYTLQIDVFQSITYSLGCLLIVSACVFYFYELFQLKRSIKLTREPAFWISSALLFFFTCTLPFIGMTNFLDQVSPVIAQNLGAILGIINFLLYSMLTIAFLCRIKLNA